MNARHCVFSDDTPIARMLTMIEVHAPRLMRSGGGGITKEIESPRRITAEKKAEAIALAGLGGMSATQIAARIGCTASAVSKMLAGLGVTSPDGRALRHKKEGHA